MKKYKLIKTYPGSPEINSEFIKYDNFWYVPIPRTSEIIPKTKIENYPEFWQEIKERKYQILSVIGCGSWDKGSLYKDVVGNEDTYIKYIKSKEVAIYSVKRLSDGEVFTIGDNVRDSLTDKLTNNKVQEIDYIIYNEKRPIFQFKSGTTAPLGTISKVNPLFTTEDGVDICEGDEYYNVFDKITEPEYELYEVTGPWISKSDTSFIKRGDSCKYFSTKEKAQEWIDWNKPKYSLNDIRTAYKQVGLLSDGVRIISALHAK